MRLAQLPYLASAAFLFMIGRLLRWRTWDVLAADADPDAAAWCVALDDPDHAELVARPRELLDRLLSRRFGDLRVQPGERRAQMSTPSMTISGAASPPIRRW